jgi:hypothetical protein
VNEEARAHHQNEKLFAVETNFQSAVMLILNVWAALSLAETTSFHALGDSVLSS